MPSEVKCPTCGKAVEWSEQSPFRPFCSKRCQLIDLGAWANEEKRIPGGDAMASLWNDEDENDL